MAASRSKHPWARQPRPSGGGDVEYAHPVIPATALRVVACVLVAVVVACS